MIKRALSESGCPPHILDDLMENCHERRWPRGLSSLETRQNNRRIYDSYVCRRIPGECGPPHGPYVTNHKQTKNIDDRLYCCRKASCVGTELWQQSHDRRGNGRTGTGYDFRPWHRMIERQSRQSTNCCRNRSYCRRKADDDRQIKSSPFWQTDPSYTRTFLII